MFDVVFISFDEPNADENWIKLRERVPYAMRIHGIKGIANAHIEAAKQVTTTHFFCVDADNIVDDSFEFNYESIINFQRTDSRVHVWGCRNPVNGLNYGYGGVKLFPTEPVKLIEEYSVDFCTSVAEKAEGFMFHNDAVSTTYFNTSPYNAWKSGYRECTKLARSLIINPNDKETKERLKIWISKGLEAEYGKYVITGARMGALMGATHTDKQINVINNFEWCKEKFTNEIEHKDHLPIWLDVDSELRKCMPTIMT